MNEAVNHDSTDAVTRTPGTFTDLRTPLKDEMTPDRTATPTGTRRASYSSPDHRTPSRWEHMGYLPVLAACAIADAINFKMAFGRLNRTEGDTALWVLVVVIALAALIAADFAGRQAKMRSVADPAANTAWGRFALVFWAGLGLAAFYVRIITPQASSGTPTTFGGDFQPAPQGTWQGEIPSALLFLCVYGISGVVAYLIEFRRYNPRRVALLTADRMEKKARNAVIDARAAAERSRAYHEHLINARNSWVARHANVITGHNALAADAKQAARLEIARHLGDPAATSALTRSIGSHMPDNHDVPLVRNS